jgi:hypothetical protein
LGLDAKQECIPVSFSSKSRTSPDADYQREKIWSREDQERLIDSIVRNIDIPKMYLARVQGNETFDFECIDGKQRMATLLSFFKPEPKESPLTVRIETAPGRKAPRRAVDAGVMRIDF